MKSFPFHGGQLLHISQRFGIPASQLIDFSANINPDGPPSSVLLALRASLEDLSTLTTYPDLEQASLKQSIGLYVGLPSKNISVANGFVPLLECVLRSLRIKRCSLPVPSFVEYRRTLELAEVEVLSSVLLAESMFRYDMEALLGANQDAILLANPQNPSGVLTDREDLLRLVKQAEQQKTIVMLDEAFIDYDPAHSLATDTNKFRNLIVFRSVTKFHGIPGMRVAYALANELLTRSISTHLSPWPITNLAATAVGTALADRAFVERTERLNRERRASLEAGLKALGLHVYDSAANFLLFRLPTAIDAGIVWERLIREHRIVLRSCLNYENLPSGHLRVAVRTPGENTLLLTAMGELLSNPKCQRSSST